MTFRWDRWFAALIVSGFTTAVTGSVLFFADGSITGKEGVILLGMFLQGCVLFMTQHPIPGITSQMIATQQAAVDVQQDKLDTMTATRATQTTQASKPSTETDDDVISIHVPKA